MKIEIEKVTPTTLFCRSIDRNTLDKVKKFADDNGISMGDLLTKIFKAFLKDVKVIK